MTQDARIPTNLRTLLILEVIGKSDRPLTPTQINTEIGLPKQTVHRLCTTLEQEGFIVRDAGGKYLRPSRRARLLGAGLLHASRFHILRHQILKKVAEQVGETVNYVVPEDTGMHYLDRIETDWAFRIQLPVGSDVPFHCTASGKVFMSTLPNQARQAFVEGLNLQKLAENTITEPDLLLRELKEIRTRGYSLDNEEFIDGMVAIAVPIKDTSGRFIAALAYHGPKQRINLDDAIASRQILFDGAQALQEALDAS